MVPEEVQPPGQHQRRSWAQNLWPLYCSIRSLGHHHRVFTGSEAAISSKIDDLSHLCHHQISLTLRGQSVTPDRARTPLSSAVETFLHLQGLRSSLMSPVVQQTAQLRSGSMQGPIGLAVHGPQIISAILEALKRDDLQVEAMRRVVCCAETSPRQRCWSSKTSAYRADV